MAFLPRSIASSLSLWRASRPLQRKEAHTKNPCCTGPWYCPASKPDSCGCSLYKHPYWCTHACCQDATVLCSSEAGYGRGQFAETYCYKAAGCRGSWPAAKKTLNLIDIRDKNKHRIPTLPIKIPVMVHPFSWTRRDYPAPAMCISLLSKWWMAPWMSFSLLNPSRAVERLMTDMMHSALESSTPHT